MENNLYNFRVGIFEYDSDTNCFMANIKKPNDNISFFERASVQFNAIRGTNPILCLSGGLDSQAQALFLIKLGIQFRAVSYAATWENDIINASYVLLATEFCQKRDIPHEIYYMDYKKFLGDEQHMHHAETYHTVSPQIAFHLEFLTAVAKSGVPLVMGTDIPEIYLDKTGEPHISLSAQFTALVMLPYYKFAKNTNTILLKDVYCQSPELAYQSYEHNIHTIEATNTCYVVSGPNKYSMHRYKANYYRTLGLDVLPPMFKRTGFEHIRRHLASISGDYDEFDRLYRYPMEKHCATVMGGNYRKTKVRIKGPWIALMKKIKKAANNENVEIISDYTFDF